MMTKYEYIITMCDDIITTRIMKYKTLVSDYHPFTAERHHFVPVDLKGSEKFCYVRVCMTKNLKQFHSLKSVKKQ